MLMELMELREGPDNTKRNRWCPNDVYRECRPKTLLFFVSRAVRADRVFHMKYHAWC